MNKIFFCAVILFYCLPILTWPGPPLTMRHYGGPLVSHELAMACDNETIGRIQNYANIELTDEDYDGFWEHGDQLYPHFNWTGCVATEYKNLWLETDVYGDAQYMTELLEQARAFIKARYCEQFIERYKQETGNVTCSSGLK